MLLSHTCANCGLSLTRIPAPLDPVYGLPVVVCPECRAACVRRSDGHRAVPRWLSRLDAAARAMVFSTVGLLAACSAFIAASSMIATSARRAGLTGRTLASLIGSAWTRDDRYHEWISGDGPILLIVGLAFGAGLGVYLTAALPHVRRRVFVPVFAACALTMLMIPALVETLERVVSAIDRGRELDWSMLRIRGESRILSAAPVAALAMLAGVPLGRRVRRSAEALRNIRWRRLRRRVRARRQAS
jgi:hypothetical protein